MLSVTQVLSKYQDFSQIPDHVLRNAQGRGTIIHAACTAYLQSIWYPPLDIAYQGYLDSFKKWADKYVSRFFWAEKRLTDREFQFHGQPDIYLQLVDNRRPVVDIKTPATWGKTWQIQLAAYHHLIINGKAGKPQLGMSLKLHPGGQVATVKDYQYTDSDFAIFLNALNAHRYILGDE